MPTTGERPSETPGRAPVPAPVPAPPDGHGHDHPPARPFPTAFVWTKMQAEGGQALADIVRRKELERAAGGGEFWWGIGNALGENLTRLIAHDPRPAVLFSIMRGRPKREDAAPDAVVVWTGYVDLAGRVTPVPDHVLVTSRAATAGGDKRRHYALVCRSDRPLRLATLGEIDASHYRNLGSDAPRVGASQVTAVVEHVERSAAASAATSAVTAPAGLPPGPSFPGPAWGRDVARGRPDGEAVPEAAPEPAQRYAVNLQAALDRPYFVRLAWPVLLPAADRAALDAAAAADPRPDEWAAFVRALRARAAASAAPAADLFSWSV